jgi:ATP-binding cassette subfamily B protein RaxB
LGKFRIGYDAFNSAIMGLENIIVIFIAASMVLNQHFSIGMMMAFITYKLQFTSKAFALVEQIIDFKMLDVHLTRLSDIVLTPPSNDGAVTHFSEPITQGQLSLKNLSYRHSENEPYLFKNIDLEIKEGKTIAIIGPSGCGKTTLLKVMLGLFTPDEGAININAVNIRDCGIDHYRSAVGAVMQDDQLLSGSIADNICFFDNKPDYTHIAHCAELAAINYDIEKMPMKYNSLVGDMGTTLSGGQKQRILLARALYRSPKILFLDEATSHLDTRLESVVNSNLKQKNITTIMIAHRPDTIRWADEVYMLENGNLCAVELPKNITKQHQTTLVANTNNC